MIPRVRWPAPGAVAAALRQFAAAVAAVCVGNPVRSLRVAGVAVAAACLCAGVAVVADLRDTAMADAKYAVRNQGVILAEQATRYFQVIDLLLKQVEVRSHELGVAAPDDFHARMGDEATHRALAVLLQNLPEAHGLGLFDASGEMINGGSNWPVRRFSIADRDYFGYLRDHPRAGDYVGTLAPSRASGKPAVYVARRIDAPGGAFLGVALVTIDATYLRRFYNTLDSHARIHAALLRRDGLVLAADTVGPNAQVPKTSRWFTTVAAGGGTYVSQGVLSGQPSVVSVNPLANVPVVLDAALPVADVVAAWQPQAVLADGALALLAGVIVALFWAISGQVRAQARHNAALVAAATALRASETRLEQAQEITGIGSWEVDVATGLRFWSRHLYRIYGQPHGAMLSRDEFGQRVADEDRPTFEAWRMALEAGQDPEPIDVRFTRADGAQRVLRFEGRAERDAAGTVVRRVGTTQDVTEQRLTQRQLVQAQKMEAIGTLTGGMAHDFNNVLGIIIGNLDMLQPLIAIDRVASELCDEALGGAERCAELIRRLLAFARRQSLRPESTDINALIRDVVRLLSRTLGEDIDLSLDLEETLWRVTVDPVQLEAALVNLATNARDAMPRGGHLGIATRNAELDAHAAARHGGLPPGDYACIEIGDTGIGMAPEVVARIFEPFFTTKGPGKGSGLGLAMAQGFAKQSGGHISVFSEPGLGTTFAIYLPRGFDAAAAAKPARPRPAQAVGDETVLVLEDNALLRRSIVRQLTESGYRVQAADRPDGALALLRGAERIDLLLTDVVMPGPMDGIEVAQEAVRRHPGLRVLFMSGFVGGPEMDRRLASHGFPLLAKPFLRSQLAGAVRAALDAPAPAVAPQPNQAAAARA